MTGAMIIVDVDTRRMLYAPFTISPAGQPDWEPANVQVSNVRGAHACWDGRHHRLQPAGAHRLLRGIQEPPDDLAGGMPVFACQFPHEFDALAAPAKCRAAHCRPRTRRRMSPCR